MALQDGSANTSHSCWLAVAGGKARATRRRKARPPRAAAQRSFSPPSLPQTFLEQCRFDTNTEITSEPGSSWDAS